MSKNNKKQETFDIVTKAINNKRLLITIREFIESLPMGNWDSNLIFLEVLMEDLADDGYIDQFKLVCDNRNNTLEDARNNTTHLDISYRQTNCLNVSRIKYSFHF